MKTLLVIGHTFPEPTTTAAGKRMLQLLQLFDEQGYSITFASTATTTQRTANTEMTGIELVSILLNDASFDEFICELDPTVVMFDRYMTEEQFGWRVTQQCPKALLILDTEDLHFLRKARELAIKDGREVEKADLFTETAKRELASIYRCDLSLIISEAEMDLLEKRFNVPKEILYYLPLFCTSPSEEQIEQFPSFENREHFITIGNFRHAPNADAVMYLKTEIWPLIRKQIPNARLYIYGAYASETFKKLHNEKEGFFLMGWVENSSEVLKNARICIAPLRFGAGLKGKILDAMSFGTPIITTEIGAEGIRGQFPFPGRVSHDSIGIVDDAVQLYSNEEHWSEAKSFGFEIVKKRFQRALFSEDFILKTEALQRDLDVHRKSNFVGQILQHHTLKSTMYMSKWIEAKNR